MILWLASGYMRAPEAVASASGVPVRERLRSLTCASLSWTCFIASFSSLKRFLAASAVPASHIVDCYNYHPASSLFLASTRRPDPRTIKIVGSQRHRGAPCNRLSPKGAPLALPPMLLPPLVAADSCMACDPLKPQRGQLEQKVVAPLLTCPYCNSGLQCRGAWPLS